MNIEPTSDREALASALTSDFAEGRISVCRLMSPEELNVISRSRTDVQGLVAGWCLCCEVPAAMWLQALHMGHQGVPNHLAVVKMGSGRKYMCIVVQVRDWQHRLCVPLVGNHTGGWLRSMVAGSPLQISVSSPDTERAFVSSTALSPGAIAELRDVDTSMEGDWRAVMDEAVRFVAWNFSASSIEGGAPLPDISKVSVSLLLPAEVEAELERKVGAAFGRKVN